MFGDLVKGFSVSLGFWLATVIFLIILAIVGLFLQSRMHKQELMTVQEQALLAGSVLRGAEHMNETSQEARARALSVLQGAEHMSSVSETAQEARARALAVLQGSEHMSNVAETAQEARARALAVLQGAEHMVGQNETVQEARDRALRILAGSEHFSGPNQTVTYANLPSLGGAPLSPAAAALRVADPLESDPISLSAKKYSQENELLAHLLNQ